MNTSNRYNIKYRTGEDRKCQICGKEFYAYRYAIDKGQAKFCSRFCMVKWQKGKSFSIATQFKKGGKPPKRKYPKGVDHPNWTEKPTYMHLHDWVRNEKGKPKSCSKCGVVGKRIEWANIDRKYNRNLEDFIALCVSCHNRHDNNLIKKQCEL